MLIQLIVVLLLLGAALYILGVVPIDAAFKNIIRVVVIIAAVIYILVKFAAPLLGEL